MVKFSQPFFILIFIILLYVIALELIQFETFQLIYSRDIFLRHSALDWLLTREKRVLFCECEWKTR